jgi:enduracididine biosynthesis enzyme MppR
VRKCFNRREGRSHPPSHSTPGPAAGVIPPDGGTGRHQVAIRFPTREALARAVRRCIDHGMSITGAADLKASRAQVRADPRRKLPLVALDSTTRLSGYSLPLSQTGRSSLVPPPPWHYSGDFLIVEYEADAEAVRAFLPPELEPGDDLGRAAAIFVDWQSCSDFGDELLDPVRAQYKEFFVVVACRYNGERVTRCPFMWVDRGMPLVRGLVQGFPKKPGSIWMTRPITVGRAGPRLERGGRFGATLAAADRRLAEATLELTHVSETGPTVNSPPLFNTRLFPAWDTDDEPVYEHVWAGGRDREISPVWEGKATLRFFGSPVDELAVLAPVRVGPGFWFSFGYTVEGGRRVE